MMSTEDVADAAGGTTDQQPENGAMADVEPVQENVGTDHSNPNSVQEKELAESKQNARAVMVESGVPLDSVEQSSSPALVSSSIINGSRKRTHSRSSVLSSSAATPPPPPLPRTTPADKIALERYVNQQFLHEALEVWNKTHNELYEEKRRERDYYTNLQPARRENPAAIFGQGYTSSGNVTNQKVTPRNQITYPKDRNRPGKRHAPQVRVSRKELDKQADEIEELVPIRLDVEWEKIKLRDTFTWNLYERMITPEVFAEYLVEDFKLPPPTHRPLVHEIVNTLKEQISDYHPHPQNLLEESLDPNQTYFAFKNDEMRMLIKLNITIGQATLVDQFEWDINNPMNSPEMFAQLTALENNLSGEFTTAIAHSIREQIQLFTKSLFITGHPFDGRPVEDPDLKAALLPSPIPSPFRQQQAQKDFMPYVYDLNEGELDRTELSFSREQRRQKRSVNRRGGPALPDLKDRPRTIRTSILSTIFPGAAETMEESRIYKRSGSGRNKKATSGQRDGVDESDESESEDSSPDSPATSQLLQGTARTRGIRNAASAAQAAMRASHLGAGRSATPEASLHLETRTSRRFGGRDYREDSSDEPDRLIVKLKISKEKFKQFLQNPKAWARRHSNSPFPKSQSATPQVSTPIQKAMAPPQSLAQSPSQRPQSSIGNRDQRSTPSQTHQQQLGVIDALYPHDPGNPAPPPPSWLVDGLRKLHETYPNDSFAAVMRYTAVKALTGEPIPTPTLPQGQPTPPNIKHQYFPRIRCNDCPGKLYTPGPGMTADNFEVHLRNKFHRERVDMRLREAGNNGAPH